MALLFLTISNTMPSPLVAARSGSEHIPTGIDGDAYRRAPFNMLTAVTIAAFFTSFEYFTPFN